MLFYTLFFLYNYFVNSIDCMVKQIHIAQGLTPASMMISWITKDDCYSNVVYGTNPLFLDNYEYGDSLSYNYTYSVNEPEFYQSEFIHHVQLNDLKSETKYYYTCGDFVNGFRSNLTYFVTLPEVGNDVPIIFGVIGDIGQSEYSLSTLDHLSSYKKINMILHTGDLSYADCKQYLWDSYGNMIEYVAKNIPWMVGAGNHEIEFNSTDKKKLYTAFESRYRMPFVSKAEFGDILIESSINPHTNLPYCTPSVFQSEYNYGNSFYSFSNGLTHIIFLNPYSNTNKSSIQYNWLLNNLRSIDRTITPWVIIIMHCPWYSSNVNHYGDKQTVLMRESMEDLLYEHNVNIVLSGHVHAYERTYPVYRNITNNNGIVYITIGNGGNLEGLDNKYYEQPSWSAFRNGTNYGHGILSIINREKLVWKWYRNEDKKFIFRDEVILCNSIFGNTNC